MPFYKPVDYYSVVAKYWDRMYKDNIQYQEVFNFIDKQRELNGYSEEIADVACGTGYLLKIFNDLGYKVFGSDLNAEMLGEAKLKLPKEDLHQISYNKVVLPKSFPMIISFFNSFAYCLDKSALTNVLNHLRSQLVSGGMIFFDLFVIDKPKEEFSVKNFTFEDGTHISRTFLGYPEDEKIFHSHFIYTIFENRIPKTVATESLRGILTNNDMISSIIEAGFEISYKGKNPGIPESQYSIMYACKKKIKKNNRLDFHPF